jgi:hypothetical protein
MTLELMNGFFQFYGCERQGSGPNIINPVASARLRTAETFGFTYGKVEVSASGSHASANRTDLMVLKMEFVICCSEIKKKIQS